MNKLQKTLLPRGLEAWCDAEHDMEDAKNLHLNFKNLYFRVKGVDGEYHIDRTGKRARAPPLVTKLCDYQHPDIIITLAGNPLVSIEITNATPYSGANPVQRLPRAVRAAELGVVSIEVAPWISNPSPATSRGVKVRFRIMEIYNVPCLSILFEYNNKDSFINAFNILLRKRVKETVDLVEQEGMEAANKFTSLDKEIIQKMKEFCDKAYKPVFRQVEIKEEYIKINIDLTGKRRYEDTKTGWETKGTGLLDPYPGYILAYDFLLCRTGPKISDRKKKIYVHFRELPKDFEFFERARKSGGYIYWNLIKKFADRVIFKEDSIN